MGGVEEMKNSNAEHSEPTNEEIFSNTYSTENSVVTSPISDDLLCRKLQYEHEAESPIYQESELCEHQEKEAMKSVEKQSGQDIYLDLKSQSSLSVELKNDPDETVLDTSDVPKKCDSDEKLQEMEIVVKIEQISECQTEGDSFIESDMEQCDTASVIQSTTSEVNTADSTELTYTNLNVQSRAFGVENENQFLSPKLPLIHHPVFTPPRAPNATASVGVRFRHLGVPQCKLSRGGNPGTPYPRTTIPHSYLPTVHPTRWQNNIVSSFQPVNYRIPPNVMVSNPSDTSSDTNYTSSFTSSSSSFLSSEDLADSSSDDKNIEDGGAYGMHRFLTPDSQQMAQYKDSFGNIGYFYPGANERENHNVKERKRRSRVAGSCSKLRNLIPGLSDKTDKATVFEYAARYLTFLREKFGTQFDQAYIEKYFQ